MRHLLVPLGLLFVGVGCHSTKTHEPDFAVVQDLDVLPTATTLTTTQTLTNCLSVDSTNVYWIDEGAIAADAGPTGGVHAVSINGGTAATLALNADPNACTAVAAGQLYYSSNGTLYSVPTDGSQAPQPLISGQHPLPARAPILATDGVHLYWVTDVYGTVDGYNGMNAIVSIPVGGATSTTTVAADLVGEPGAFAILSGNFYYSDRNGADIRTLAGGAATMFGQSVLHSNHLAVGGSHVALVEITGVGAGDLAVFALDGSQRVQLVDKLVGALAVDDSGVYANDNGQLMHYSLDGKSATQLTAAPPRAIALDATSVYFTDGASIYKLSK